MPEIYLETFIAAPIEAVFDLSRSIDFHKYSMTATKEEAIGGRTSGHIMLGETVTWRAKHFGMYQKLTVRITKMERPHGFTDEMKEGIFTSMVHTHKFLTEGEGTKMLDTFKFKSPFGLLGSVVNFLFLKRYMTKLLQSRNKQLKDVAEGKALEILGVPS